MQVEKPRRFTHYDRGETDQIEASVEWKRRIGPEVAVTVAAKLTWRTGRWIANLRGHRVANPIARKMAPESAFDGR